MNWFHLCQLPVCVRRFQHSTTGEGKVESDRKQEKVTPLWAPTFSLKTVNSVMNSEGS